MKKLDLNLLVLHCYTGGAQRYVSYVEPMIRIQYRNVLPEARLDTSLTARWGYRPLSTRNFAFGSDKLFPPSGGINAFGSEAALLADTNQDRYERAQGLIRAVITMAHARGTGTAEISPALKTLIQRDGPLFARAGKNSSFTGTWSLAYIRSAHAYLKRRAPHVRLAISGWGGKNQFSAIMDGLGKVLPSDIVFACLNPAQGELPQAAVMADIAKRRDVIAMPWLEGDQKLWHPQPRISYIRQHVLLAYKQGFAGVVAIHWRTEDVRVNMEAFAELKIN